MPNALIRDQLSPPKKRGVPRWVWVILGLSGGGASLTCLACGGFGWWLSRSPRITAEARQPFQYDTVAAPEFPSRGQPQQLEGGVDLYTIRLGAETDGYYSTPGHGGKLWLYLPSGEHAEKSLPCVLIAPAGATIGAGMPLVEDDQLEHLPYVRAGYAVVAFEVDGPLDDDAEPAEFNRAYKAFKASRAGLVNARNALRFTLENVPEVDPGRIYTAGHSSAADLSLLFAEHEPRLAGCVAYMPSYDHVQWLTPAGLQLWTMMSSGSKQFVLRRSPSTHIDKLTCPVLLFHAEDDQNVRVEIVRDGAAAMKAAGVDVTFQSAASGGHYFAMLEEGIPAGVKWLNERDAAKKSEQPK